MACTIYEPRCHGNYKIGAREAKSSMLPLKTVRFGHSISETFFS